MPSIVNIMADKRLKRSNYSDPNNDESDIQGALSAVADGQDKKAFEFLFKYFSPKIRAFGLQRLGQEAQALELVQETMLLVWRKASLFNADKGKATTWIYTVMRNLCFDMLRKKQSQKEDPVSDDLWPFLEEEQEVDDDHLLSRNLLAHIAELPVQQQQVIEAMYINELSQQEVACLLNIPLGTVKSRLRLAIGKLKATLEIEYD